MSKLLWAPSEVRRQDANITRFISLVNARHNHNFGSYWELYDWSIRNLADFWAAMWDFGSIKFSKKYDHVIDDPSKMPGAKWFTGASLNFAENLLRYRDDRTAFIFRGESQISARMSYAELYDSVARLATSLREIGVVPGDRVAGYMPNMIETAIAMLASTSIGATWASCATDIGQSTVLDRLGQIDPKVLFTANGYYYKGKWFDVLPNVEVIVNSIPSLEKVIVTSYTEKKSNIQHIRNSVYYDDFLAKEEGLDIQFEQLPFDHPVYIMFSSGTTGKPKCLVQGSGGVLLNQLKELTLHADLKREDVHFYITTCSWMMWNWLICSLAVGATVLLYDGNPAHPNPSALWKLIQDEKVTILGTSATYIDFLRNQRYLLGKEYDLSALREISQTGSPLSEEGFEYVYQGIKNDLHFNSLSGGTDINGCFAIGTPVIPVYAGELQCPGLGIKIKAYDDVGKSILDRQGELVCEAAIPSMPLYFWNDPDGEKYRDAYFDVYPGVWRHGDYILVHGKTGGITFFGRSDSVLKPSGVRIGTAEIYNQMEKLEEIEDSLAIGQNWKGDQRIILFVKLAYGYELNEDLVKKIKNNLRKNTSPRHVPSKIIAAPDIPYTMNMKKVESAITNIVNGRPVLNRDALKNPESLDFYEKLSIHNNS